MNIRLILEDRRLAAHKSYKQLADEFGIIYTSIFRFIKGEIDLSPRSIQAIASKARADDDLELLSALASYALGVDLKVNLN